MKFFSDKSAITKLQAVIAVIIVVVAVTAAVYHATLLAPNPTASPTPSPSLIPLPFAALGFYPEPNSTNVPLDTNISITFSRPPQIVQLRLYPPPEGWMCQFKETVGIAGGKFTFHFSEPLKQGTSYIVTIIYGQEYPPDGFKPLSTAAWNFTTAP